MSDPCTVHKCMICGRGETKEEIHCTVHKCMICGRGETKEEIHCIKVKWFAEQGILKNEYIKDLYPSFHEKYTKLIGTENIRVTLAICPQCIFKAIAHADKLKGLVYDSEHKE